MRGRRATVVLGAALVTIAFSGGIADAATCPNEAFRTGPSALLGECRAYEMVSPVEKEGGAGVSQPGYVQAGLTGDGVTFTSSSAYAGAEGNNLYNRYVSTRAGGAWGTHDIDGPQETQESLFIRATFAVSPDLGKSVTASRRAFTPGANEGGSNLYLRDTATGASTLIATDPGAFAFRQWAGFNETGPFVDASDDWSTILLTDDEVALTPDAAPKEPNVYEFRDGRLSLAAPPGASPISGASTAVDPNVMSADGHRFFYYENEIEKVGEPGEELTLVHPILYLHEDGSAPIPISVSEREADEGEPAEAIFVGANPTGDVVYFTSAGALTEDASGGPSLFRYELSAPAGERLTDITPAAAEPAFGSPNVLTVIGFAEAGDFVYFTAKGSLAGAPELPEGNGANIYAWHGARGTAGEIRYVGRTTVGGEQSGPPFALVSADGRYLGFESAGEVTPEAVEGSEAVCPEHEAVPAGRCSNVFLYSYDTGRLRCVSCDGAPPKGDSELGGRAARLERFTYVSRAVLDDGTIFFDSPNALVSRDINGVGDAYAWRGEAPFLLSSGTGTAPSLFGDSTLDGSNVFIKTSQRLVGQDVDDAFDVYDVRVGGGLEQAGATTTEPCGTEAGCRGAPAQAASPVTPASGTVAGRGNVAGRCLDRRAKARTLAAGARALGHRARKASGGRAKALRAKAAKRHKQARRATRAANRCGGGR